MKTLRQFLTEKNQIREMPWDPDPVIGWWRDNDEQILYHGTHERNIPHIIENGLTGPETGYTAGLVSLTHDPNTAFGYASMSGSGGERNFRGVNAKPSHTPPIERVVFILVIPTDLVLETMAPMRGAMKKIARRLTTEEEYREWDGSDQEYYALTEVRLPSPVAPKWIVGYSRKIQA